MDEEEKQQLIDDHNEKIKKKSKKMSKMKSLPKRMLEKGTYDEIDGAEEEDEIIGGKIIASNLQ